MILTPIVDEFLLSDDFQEFKSKFENNEKIIVQGISQSSFPLIVSSVFNYNKKLTIIVTENAIKMEELYLNLSCMVDPLSVFKFPSWDTIPYEFFPPIEKNERDRVNALYKIINNEPVIIVTTLESIIRKIPHKKFFLNRGIQLDTKDEYSFDDIIDMLVTYGYSRELKVETFGQFSVKGGIIDVFLSTDNNPVRLDFFGDELESIREFDPATQVSVAALDFVKIFPRKELILFEKERKELLKIFKEELKKGNSFSHEIESNLSENFLPDFDGIEDYFSLIIESVPLSSYLPEETNLIFLETIELTSKKNKIIEEFEKIYNKKADIYRQKPEALIDYEIFDLMKDRSIELQTTALYQEGLVWGLKSIPNFQGKITHLREEIDKRLETGWKVIVTTSFEGQARRLFDLLNKYNPNSDFDSINEENFLNIVITPLREGFEFISKKILILSEHEIFGKSYRKRNQFKRKKSKPIESFLEMVNGDYIVHINHGIGIFQGIERMTAGGVERDFFLIEYADGDKLYIPLDQIMMIQKYVGTEKKKPRIDYLGKKSAWNRIKARVKENVEKIAAELIKIYSMREGLKGYQYPPDTMWQEEFEAKFEYDETPDQITAIEDVKDDMESTKPMDRLVCGDVGFGKTEVAIRAAFKSVMAGKQVAILVPTTVLAMQHFSNFKKRFGEYPIEIEMISRFRTQTEVKKIKLLLSEGKVDIIIGTHGLVSKNIKIKNLGLLIIDEEQKFGVKHKEELKKIKAMVDIMTLSATPIPRTLHLSMAGIRDLSIIATAPENRQAIETYVMEENPDVLRKAILTEIERKGQVYFVHNRVRNIDAFAIMLEKLVPEATFCVGHGQQDKYELEEIMIDFLNKKYDVLISTTIIESGLDIPNVNTIIINRADTFGLSQLYQLKGRVGRSNRKAFAYLFFRKNAEMTEDARKRLQVISEYSDLGSGFKIAMKDMEIRGAGNILGTEQSGSIMDVGFDLYLQMLDHAVKNLKGDKDVFSFRTPIFVNSDFFIPDTYISDERQKIEFYKRLESCDSSEEVEKIRVEMKDRFGIPPKEISILIEIEEIRAIASSLLIDEIIEDSRSIKIKISEHSKIDPMKIIDLISKDKRFSIDPKNNEKLIFMPVSKDSEKKLIELKKWLQQIS